MKPDPRNKTSAPARRRFMTAAGVVCAGTAAHYASAGTIAGTVVALSNSVRSDLPFQASRFRACLGNVFQVRSLVHDTSPVQLTLARVSPSPFQTPARAAKGEAFSIDLAGAAAPLAQDTYAVSHPKLGEFIALLVPTADGRTLVGVFDTAA